jgi:hypothetical protein
LAACYSKIFGHRSEDTIQPAVPQRQGEFSVFETEFEREVGVWMEAEVDIVNEYIPKIDG